MGKTHERLSSRHDSRKRPVVTERTETPQTAKIKQVFGDKGYGLMITREGKEMRFLRECVLNYAFEHLKPGTTVAFTLTQGKKGPEVTNLKVLRREGPHGTVHRHAA